MTFEQIWQVSVQQGNVNRVRVAMVKAAIAVSAEPVNTPNHANRAAFARSALLNPEAYAGNMTLGVATDPTVQANPTDENIYDAIAGQWNAYAGAP